MNQTEITQTSESSRGIVTLAKMLKARENQAPNEPIFGTIISVSPIRVQLDNKKILIESRNIASIVNIDAIDSFGNYINLGRRVAMLPFNTGYINSMPDFLILGVVT